MRRDRCTEKEGEGAGRELAQGMSQRARVTKQGQALALALPQEEGTETAHKEHAGCAALNPARFARSQQSPSRAQSRSLGIPRGKVTKGSHLHIRSRSRFSQYVR